MKIMGKSQLEPNEKQLLAEKIVEHETIKKRLLRQKDSLHNYELHQIIGKGAFGQVRLAKNKQTSTLQTNSDEVVAIKRMQKKRLVGKKQISSAYL